MIKIKWLGQGGYLIDAGGAQVCVDPYLSDSLGKNKGHTRMMEPPVTPGELVSDIIFITHEHGDHLDAETITATKFDRHIYMGPDKVCAGLIKLGVPQARVKPVSEGDTVRLGSAKLRAVYAEHSADALGLVIDDDIRAYFTGDCLLTDATLNRCPKSVDVLVVCINGKWGNMSGIEAVRLAHACGAKLVVPSHYGMFPENTADPRAFCLWAERTGFRCAEHKAGEWMNLSETARA